MIAPITGAMKKTTIAACQPRNAPIMASSVTSPKPIASRPIAIEASTRMIHTSPPPTTIPARLLARAAQCGPPNRQTPTMAAEPLAAIASIR